jgi:hypothetical protein
MSVRFKALATGLVVDVGGTIIASLYVGMAGGLYVGIAIGLNRGLPDVLDNAPEGLASRLAGLLFGAFFALLGGFVAGRIDTHTRAIWLGLLFAAASLTTYALLGWLAFALFSEPHDPPLLRALDHLGCAFAAVLGPFVARRLAPLPLRVPTSDRM